MQRKTPSSAIFTTRPLWAIRKRPRSEDCLGDSVPRGPSMRTNACAILGLAWLLAFATALRAGEPPVIPIGLDAYRQWERWPYQRIGARACMRSTYDRRGGNEGADASHFLYQLADDFNVTLDVEGAGILYFARYNHWH